MFLALLPLLHVVLLGLNISQWLTVASTVAQLIKTAEEWAPLLKQLAHRIDQVVVQMKLNAGRHTSHSHSMIQEMLDLVHQETQAEWNRRADRMSRPNDVG